MELNDIQKYFEDFIGEPVASFQVLPQSGSERMNIIAASLAQKYIITYNQNIRENEAFFYWSAIFGSLELNGPKIFSIHEDRNLYIQEFVGEKTLSEVITEEGLSERTKSLVRKSLTLLFELQQKTKGKIDFSKCFEYEVYDELPILHDLYYFKNFFIDVLEIPYHKSALLKEFKSLVKKIENLSPKVVMIRDFQSRNIMVNENDEIYFIDYQGAMEGPAMYDVISFLFQAKANFPADFQEEAMREYCELWKNEEAQKSLQVSVFYIRLIRYLQVLGAYGFRGLIQRKAHFLQSLPQGVKNAVSLAIHSKEMEDFPELKKLILSLEKDEVARKINDHLKIG